MNVIKIMVGILAIAWVAFQVTDIIVRGTPHSEILLTTYWLAKTAAILFGIAVAIKCLRPRPDTGLVEDPEDG